MPAEDGTTGGLSLVDYARKQRRSDCSVCQLPTAVREQMRDASDRKIRRSVVLAWLREVHGSSVTDVELTAHYSGKHDQ